MYCLSIFFITLLSGEILNLSYAEKICKTLNDDLKDAKRRGEGKATIELVYKSCQEGFKDDQSFAYGFMERIASIQMDFTKPNTGDDIPTWLHFIHPDATKVERYQKDYTKALNRHTFTLRHYTSNKEHPGQPPAFKIIRSCFDLKRSGKPSSHTRLHDWIYLGNTAFTFWLLCIDGQEPPGRKLVSEATHYAEIKLDKTSLTNKHLDNLEFFASADLLSSANKLSDGEIRPKLVRGSIEDLAPVILGTLSNNMVNGLNAESILTVIDDTFRPMFEVKIPGSVSDVDWVKNNKFIALSQQI